jgi:hypothetical protein
MCFFCPQAAEVFAGCGSFAGLESTGEVVGVDEVQVLPEVVLGLVIEALYGGFFQSPVHAFDLFVGPGMYGFGQTMVDVGLGAGELEGVGAEESSTLESEVDLSSSRTAIARSGEVHSVVGEYGVHLAGLRFDQLVQEVGRNPPTSLFTHSTKANLEMQSTANLRDLDSALPDLLYRLECRCSSASFEIW